ncbi:MAG: 2-hydroxyacid dehydrogenase [Legionellaceae bacterium]|nr:2-hydroxyacid dehydrogenase [Legionellaceae bacterium]
MKVAIYSIKDYEKTLFDAAEQPHTLVFIRDTLSLSTVHLAAGCDAICCFVTDDLNSEVIKKLSDLGVKLIALRSAGFDHVDLAATKHAGITVVRVPQYSPEAIAEFTVGLILILNRKIIAAYEQGLKHNFSLERLMGFNLSKKTVGIIGTGNIGTAFAKIMHGFGCRLLAVDPQPNDTCRNLKVKYVTLDFLLKESDIVSLHCLLNDHTRYLMDTDAFSKIKKGAMLINTGRGTLCDTQALIQSLESGHLGYAGLDVYEKEHDLFFRNHQHDKIQDPLFLKLQSLPNVLITPHQAFLTQEAVENIIHTTLNNITAFEQGHPVEIVQN